MELLRDTSIALVAVNKLLLDSDSADAALCAVENVFVRVIVPELAD